MVTGTRTLRFTPTCVGNTCAYFVLVNNSTVHPHMRGEYVDYKASQDPTFAVHPHMRGEYRNNSKVESTIYGSPPHAWGILHDNLWIQRRCRFTPTCVGNT